MAEPVRTHFNGTGQSLNGTRTPGAVDCKIDCSCPEPTSDDLMIAGVITMIVGLVLGIIGTILSIACPLLAVGAIIGAIAGLASGGATGLFIGAMLKS